ncbi:MAG: hypothetical protein CMH81_06685 [Nitrospiraceae bacterium]|nr:hypothetical protein [Nitrospiraceae bacterium]
MKPPVFKELCDIPLRPRVGISRCLLGERVRYDGGHKNTQVIAEELGTHFQWVPVCPEVECGLGIPRETLQMIGTPDTPRLMTSGSNQDMTEMLLKFSDFRMRDLLTTGIHGFILKARSPSCGLDDVPVYQAHSLVAHGRGLFASVVTTHCPSLPVEDETRLQHRVVRTKFIERVVAYQRKSMT